jgi:hypothetical protein
VRDFIVFLILGQCCFFSCAQHKLDGMGELTANKPMNGAIFEWLNFQIMPS